MGIGRPILEIPYRFYCERSGEVGAIQYRCGQGASDFGEPIQLKEQVTHGSSRCDVVSKHLPFLIIYHGYLRSAFGTSRGMVSMPFFS